MAAIDSRLSSLRESIRHLDLLESESSNSYVNTSNSNTTGLHSLAVDHATDKKAFPQLDSDPSTSFHHTLYSDKDISPKGTRHYTWTTGDYSPRSSVDSSQTNVIRSFERRQRRSLSSLPISGQASKAESASADDAGSNPLPHFFTVESLNSRSDRSGECHSQTCDDHSAHPYTTANRASEPPVNTLNTVNSQAMHMCNTSVQGHAYDQCHGMTSLPPAVSDVPPPPSGASPSEQLRQGSLHNTANHTTKAYPVDRERPSTSRGDKHLYSHAHAHVRSHAPGSAAAQGTADRLGFPSSLPITHHTLGAVDDVYQPFRPDIPLYDAAPHWHGPGHGHDALRAGQVKVHVAKSLERDLLVTVRQQKLSQAEADLERDERFLKDRIKRVAEREDRLQCLERDIERARRDLVEERTSLKAEQAQWGPKMKELNDLQTDVQTRSDVSDVREKAVQRREEEVRCREDELRVRWVAVQQAEDQLVALRAQLDSRTALLRDTLRERDCMIVEREERVSSREVWVREREHEMEAVREALRVQGQHMDTGRAALADADARIRNREADLDAKLAHLRTWEDTARAAHSAKALALSELERELAVRGAEIQALARANEEKGKDMAQRQTKLSQLETDLEHREHSLKERERVVSNAEGRWHVREAEMGAQEAVLARKLKEIDITKQQLEIKAKALEEQSLSLSARESVVLDAERMLSGREAELCGREGVVSVKEVSLQGLDKREAALRAREMDLDRREVELAADMARAAASLASIERMPR
eukprot:TRINITY_DN2021_c0_g1::TRINITY_DN2021_c0_g1_i1::g.21914::m.21914 TRINITY_DN2021_c0_g1::TRINITY_DN2021_c0_g1_i1::g.21914  ORF type:complete len:766 (-),score=138.86,DUF3552/PF12072.3/9.5e+03,DUF3552/PF12072.3/1.6,DUF3552/PF12072.3/0.12,DUF3552/PF12072.3/8.4,DUF3552/PF12072.3/0.078,DUF3552/PF12072.3/24,DUF3552/PF12072.3/0.78 TRINITY_DN2021_c0_g1_i1:41-2338(-)